MDGEPARHDDAPDVRVAIGDGLDVILISENEVLIQYGTRSSPSELFRDTNLAGLPGQIFGRLVNGPTSLAALLEEVPAADREDARSFVNDLLARGILTDAQSSPVEQYLRYSFTGESQLAGRGVGLIGAGPVGARLAYSLLQHGIGRLTLLDDRPGDPRSTAFILPGPAPSDPAGRPAHLVLRERLHAVGHTEVEVAAESLDVAGLEALVERSDLVAVALDQLSLSVTHLVNRLCLRARKPWLLATIDGNLGLVGPLFVPVETACFNDFRVLADAATPSSEMARLYRRHLLSRGAGSFFPGLPAYAEIVAGHATLALVHYLLRETCFAVGRVMIIDFDRMTIDVEDVLKLPRCPACGAEKSAYRPAFPAELIQAGGGRE